MPMRPPRSDRVSASTRNWARMSRPRAPTALRMPISRVRSRTETSMMFMIPMPPTISEIEAIPASSRVSVAVIDDAASSSWVWLKTLKSAVSAGGQLVPVTEQGGDLGARGGHPVGVGDGDADRPDRVAADEILLDDADRDDDLVVGVLEPGPALGLQDADDPERQAADRDLRPEVAGAETEGGGGRGAQDGDPQVLVEARVGQERALPDVVGTDRSGRPGSCRRPWSWHSPSRP